MGALIGDEKIVFTDIICNSCIYNNKDGTCIAYPKGIDVAIIKANNHSKPIKNQKNNIVYKAIKVQHETIRED